jgi:chemotaxis protein methyltransferase CheR
MKREIFDRFRRIAYEHAGIHLKEGKESLVDARVAKRLRALGLSTPEQYLDLLERDESGDELVQFLDAISTNFTSFFREQEHFELLGAQIKRWLDDGQRKFRIWSAASSTGEEPYSIAITVAEATAGVPVDARILATDISTRVLAHASRGVYELSRLGPLSPARRGRFFVHVDGPKGAEPYYQVIPEIRRLVLFKRLNLSARAMPMHGPLDVVFVRNVMMYFDTAVRQSLIWEVERLLRVDGLLLIGHAESLSGLKTSLTQVKPSVFRKAAPSHRAACGTPTTTAQGRRPATAGVS